jgi:hypothetical protein
MLFGKTAYDICQTICAGMYLKFPKYPMFPKDVPEVPDVPLVPTVMNIVWQNPHQIAKQYCTGDPDAASRIIS